MPKKSSKKKLQAPEGDTPITIPLDELYKYKLQVLEREFTDAKDALVNPLREYFQKEFERQVRAAVEANPACIAAYNAKAECVNALVDTVEPTIPAGYVVSEVNPETGKVVLVHNPDKAGQRLPLKGVPEKE